MHVILCCAGAIDGKHIVTQAPANSGSLYYNYKGTHSVVLMAVVDSMYRFLLVDVGKGFKPDSVAGIFVVILVWYNLGDSGKHSDGGVFANSAFGQALENGALDIPEDSPLPGFALCNYCILLLSPYYH